MSAKIAANGIQTHDTQTCNRTTVNVLHPFGYLLSGIVVTI